jgi:hypothetical protein
MEMVILNVFENPDIVTWPLIAHAHEYVSLNNGRTWQVLGNAGADRNLLVAL